ncbi:hypothetical protein D1007_35884 [Hordeum vulgare]|nr:hypothetical protein D1007_35884 [Hordeum vulgare]
MHNPCTHQAPHHAPTLVHDAACLGLSSRHLLKLKPLLAPGTTRLPRVLAICSLSWPLLSGGLFSLLLQLLQGCPYSIAPFFLCLLAWLSPCSSSPSLRFKW